MRTAPNASPTHFNAVLMSIRSVAARTRAARPRPTWGRSRSHARARADSRADHQLGQRLVVATEVVPTRQLDDPRMLRTDSGADRFVVISTVNTKGIGGWNTVSLRP